jgi:hypothetical protein
VKRLAEPPVHRQRVVSILILVMIGSLVSSQLPARFSEAVGTDFVQLWGVAVALLGLLGVSLGVVVGRRREPLRAAVDHLLRDPSAVLALGILLTAAASPLFWSHYYVLLLLPALWLLSVPSTSRRVPALAAVSVVMGGGVVGMPLAALGWSGLMRASIALCWVPLWVALLVHLRRSSAGADARQVVAAVNAAA